ncbi:Septum site-determining protein MinD [Listeria monocytogenes]|nr:Septum site-determining protein MinD [Listeria monocytogenes]
MGEAIVITSGKGGVGKTTSTANLGTALALQGKKVCLIDMDIGLRNLDVVLGLENRIIYDLVDVVEGRCKIHQAMIKDKRFDDLLFLLPAAQTTDKNAVSGEQMVDLINQLRPDYDFILIDCPAGIETGYKNAVAGADKAIVVTTKYQQFVMQIELLLEKEDIEPPKLIINRIRTQMMMNGDVMDIDEITYRLNYLVLSLMMMKLFALLSYAAK